MINPDYRFYLDGRPSSPVYGEGLSINYQRVDGEQFFRASLEGELSFIKEDYAYIMEQPFDHEFSVTIHETSDLGETWDVLWEGSFHKTDCETDKDSQVVRVTPEVVDVYTPILEGMEKEFNLIDLAPAMVQVVADKRPMVQVYVPGETTIGCFLSGMWWEQECDMVTEADMVSIGGRDFPALTHKYYFARLSSLRQVLLSGTTMPSLPMDAFFLSNPPTGIYFSATSGIWTLDVERINEDTDSPLDTWTISRNGSPMWQYRSGAVSPEEGKPYSVTLSPYPGSGAGGSVTLDISDINVYGRYLMDVDSFQGMETNTLPTDDMGGDNRNYHRVIGYAVSGTIFYSTTFSNTPTKWGLYQPNAYYQQPSVLGIPDLFPVGRNGWGRVSIWYAFPLIDWLAEREGRAPFTIKDAYPLWGVVSSLLGEVAPGITFDGDPEYSQFLYGHEGPWMGGGSELGITPKSNIVTAGYDQPAQKAPITLRAVLDMLRDCFRCYWFVDEDGFFRIEHVTYFERGGSYDGEPVLWRDLMREKTPRNGKSLAWGLGKWTYDKPDMPSRYQFAWMDDVTQLFEGYPMDMVSGYVDRGRIEDVRVDGFTSDLDYILLNPGAVSKDGFVLLSIQGSDWGDGVMEGSGTQGNGIVFPIDLSPWTGQWIWVRVSGSVAGLKVAQSDAISEIEDIGTIQAANTIETFRFQVKYPRIIMYGDFSSYTGRITDISGGSYVVPYLTISHGGMEYRLQNGLASFASLQGYYTWDLPSPMYELDGERLPARGVKRLRVQDVSFPCPERPDLYGLIRTNIGDGVISRLSLNLSSRNATATLYHANEQ